MAVGVEWHSAPPDLGVGAAGTTLHRTAPLVVAPRVGVGVVHQARLGGVVAVGGERGRRELLVTVQVLRARMYSLNGAVSLLFFRRVRSE